jgi:Cu(I)/Ag(I) efflux system membrane protein CusA/SilA
LQVPGLINSWTYPIRGRIDMLLSGIRTPLGIKLYGLDLSILNNKAKEIEVALRDHQDTLSVFADQTSAGYYIDIKINDKALQQYNINKDTILEYIGLGVGGMPIGTMYQGLERYPISIRFQEEERQTLKAIKNISVKTKFGFIPLGRFITINYKERASVIKSEMAKPVTFIYITPKNGISATEYKANVKEIINNLKLPTGYYIEWAGQSEYLDSAMEKIKYIIPTVLLAILMLIYFALKEVIPTLIVFFTLPFALLGGLIYVDILDFSMSVAVIVGFLALLGVASETAIVMIVYLQESVKEKKNQEGKIGKKALREAIYSGAVQRVRPKLMTVFAILAGLLPIMYNNGVGSEVMQRIAAPMIGGVVSSAILSLLLIPIFYEIYQSKTSKL